MSTTEPSTGARTWSRVTVTVDVAHDGAPAEIGDHLGLVLTDAIGRQEGVDLLDGPDVTASVIDAGDERSGRLPAWS